MQAIAAWPIGTGRLALLPPGAEHAGEMAAVLADPGLHVFIGGTPAGRWQDAERRTLVH